MDPASRLSVIDFKLRSHKAPVYPSKAAITVFFLVAVRSASSFAMKNALFGTEITDLFVSSSARSF